LPETCVLADEGVNVADEPSWVSHGQSGIPLSGGRYHERTIDCGFQQVPEGYAGLVEELTGATLEKARTNLQEGLLLVLESNQVLAEEVRTTVSM
jgi:hypothetical protein